MKSKRFVLSSIKKRIRNKFNVSIAEVENNDKWQRISLGVAMISNERKFLDMTVEKILKLIESDGRMEVLNHLLEVY